jgi:ABC-2 type transport system ATP-binding protein
LNILGLSEKRDKLAATLSGGMQRRLNLALGLVHDPDILILDEPEAGLDPQSRVLVREYIRSLAGQKTIILTTHNMDEADRIADRVAIIDQGKLLVLDTPEALKGTVGEGDVLELEVLEISPAQVLTNLEQIIPNGSTSDRKLILRAQNIVEKLPSIIKIVQNAGGGVGEVHLRANTLEDVFIALTGRRLRQ